MPHQPHLQARGQALEEIDRGRVHARLNLQLLLQRRQLAAHVGQLRVLQPPDRLVGGGQVLVGQGGEGIMGLLSSGFRVQAKRLRMKGMVGGWGEG